MRAQKSGRRDGSVFPLGGFSGRWAFGGRAGEPAEIQKRKEMMFLAKYAVFVDLENCGAKVTTLSSILEKVKMRGDILLGRVYGYTDRFSDLKEILLSNTFQVVPSIRYGIAQKNNADIQLVVDALEVAYTNPLIDSFCIVSGDSDYMPLVGRLKSMGGRTTAKTGKTRTQKQGAVSDEMMDLSELNKQIVNICEEQSDTDGMYASELKNVLMRLRPDFNEKAYGCPTFFKLLTKLQSKFGDIHVKNDNYNVIVNLTSKVEESAEEETQLTRENWREAFKAQLDAYKEGGFDRINPSILKADILTTYPNFNERSIGFKRFSDVMKQLEKDGLVRVEMDEQKTMLVQLL